MESSVLDAYRSMLEPLSTAQNKVTGYLALTTALVLAFVFACYVMLNLRQSRRTVPGLDETEQIAKEVGIGINNGFSCFKNRENPTEAFLLDVKCDAEQFATWGIHSDHQRELLRSEVIVTIRKHGFSMPREIVHETDTDVKDAGRASGATRGTRGNVYYIFSNANRRFVAMYVLDE